MALATIPGYPRIGKRRELKRALEGYWSGKRTAADKKAALRSIVDRYQHSAEVYDRWGFSPVPGVGFEHPAFGLSTVNEVFVDMPFLGAASALCSQAVAEICPTQNRRPIIRIPVVARQRPARFRENAQGSPGMPAAGAGRTCRKHRRDASGQIRRAAAFGGQQDDETRLARGFRRRQGA